MMIKILCDGTYYFLWDSEAIPLGQLYYRYDGVYYPIANEIKLRRTKFNGTLGRVDLLNITLPLGIKDKVDVTESSWAEYRLMKSFSQEKIVFKELKSKDWNVV